MSRRLRRCRAALPRLRRAVVAAGCVAGVATGLSALSLASGCSSAKKMTQLQTLDGVADPATGKPLELVSPDQAARLGASAGGTVATLMRTGRQSLDAGDDDRARASFEAVLAQQPQHGKAHHFLAVIADRQKRFGQAEGHYKIALDQLGDDAAVLSDLGYSYTLQGRYDDAETYLKRSRSVDPAYKIAIANLADLYRRQGDRDKSLAMLKLVASDADAEAKIADWFADTPTLDPPGVRSKRPPQARLAGNEPLAGNDQSDRIAELESKLAALTAAQSIPAAIDAGSQQPLPNVPQTAAASQTAAPQTAAPRFEPLPAPPSDAELSDALASAQAATATPAEPDDSMAAFLQSLNQTAGQTPDRTPTEPAAIPAARVALPTIRPGDPTADASRPAVGVVQMPTAPPARSLAADTGPASGVPTDSRREAVRLAIALSSGSSWTSLAAAAADAPAPAVATPPTQPVDTPPAPRASEMFSAGLPSTDASPTGIQQPPKYDPSQSQASFGPGGNSQPAPTAGGLNLIVPTGATPSPAAPGVTPIPTVTPGARGVLR